MHEVNQQGYLRRIESIKAMLKSDGISLEDKDSAIKSLSQTVAVRQNIECYMKSIYQFNAGKGDGITEG